MPAHDPNQTTDLPVKLPGNVASTPDLTRQDASTDPNATQARDSLAHGSLGPLDAVGPTSVVPAIPGYEIEGELGRGGMGVVYRARQTDLNRPVAIKMILGGKYTDPVAQARFLVEAEVIAAIQNPHIVQVHEFGRHDDQPFFVLEFVGGGSLAGKLKAVGRFAPRDAAVMVAKLAEGMAAAHQKGVVHRDLKPANVLLTESGEPKITDFGLAKTGQSDMTATGAVMGTPSYMSPEQAAGKTSEVGTPADVYALGAILYELLSGRAPFKSDTVMATIHQVLTREPTRLRGLDPKIPRDLETICLKCLEKDTQKRYATADALAADLRAFLEWRPITARPVGTAERAWKWAKRNPGRATAIAATILLLAGIGIAVDQVRTQREADRLAAEAEIRHKQRQTRAGALVDALTTADTTGVPRLIEELQEYRDLTGTQLRELATQPVTTKAGLHARLALMADEPNRVAEVTADVPACRPEELLTIRKVLQPHAGTVAPVLWVTVEDEKLEPSRRARVAGVLAGLTPKDSRWSAVAPLVIEAAVHATPDEFVVWSESLDTVRDALVPLLVKRYTAARSRIRSRGLDESQLVAEASAFEMTANLLARYTKDRPADLAELAMIVDSRHYAMFEDAIRKNGAAVVPILKAELGKSALPAWAGNGEIGPALAAMVGVPAVADVVNPDPVIDALAKRQGNAAAALVTLGQADAVWPRFAFPNHGDPSVRSYLLVRLAGIGADPVSLMQRFQKEADASARRALLIALGDFPSELIPVAEWEPFVSRLLVLYRDDSDSGLHSAIDWVLRQKWGRAEAIKKIDAELTAAARGRAAARVLAGAAPALPFGGIIGPMLPASREALDKDWYVNSQGQTFAVVRGPVVATMGSPKNEPGRSTFNEFAHRRRINRSFAIATKEVTSEEFLRCKPLYLWLERDNQGPQSPAVAITWYDCAMYCNWLSERDGIPEAQWCYEPNKDGGLYVEGMTIKPRHLSLTGYRLPTEAEWEYSSRSGSVVARYYGRGVELLPRYGLFVQTRDESARPVGQMRPNDRGLFDSLGNAAEWVEDPPLRYSSDADDEELVGYSTINERSTRTLRGGSSVGSPAFLRSAHRDHAQPGQRNYTYGFRPVRTLP